jgi:hypothetical protein
VSERPRQTAFERGILLALVAVCQDAVSRMASLREQSRWVVAESDITDLQRILDRMQDNVIRAERSEDRD